MKKKFGDGVKLYKAGKFADALPLFQEVVQATASPNAHLYIGYCQSELGHDAEAYEAFNLAIKESSAQDAEKYEQTKQAAISELATLNTRVGRIAISVADIPPELVVELDGVRVEEQKLGAYVVLKPGQHHIEAHGRDVEPVLRDVNVDAGETKTVALAFRATAKPEAPKPLAPSAGGNPKLRTYGWVAGGVGVTGLAVFAVAGVMTKNTYDDLSRQCAAGCSDSSHQNDIRRGKTLQTTANVGLVVGGLGLAASGALLFLGYSGSHDSGVTVAVAPGGGSVGYGGRF